MARHMLLLMFKMVGARAQLRVFSAGVWHNLVLGVAAWTTSTTLPTILSPLYFPALTGSIVYFPALTGSIVHTSSRQLQFKLFN